MPSDDVAVAGARLERGVVRSGAVVTEKGARYPSPVWMTDYCPLDGDTVMMLTDAGQAVVLGPVATASRPNTGTVTVAASGGKVTLTAGGVTYNVPYVGTAPGVGALAALIWQGSSPVVAGVASAASSGTTNTSGDPIAPPSANYGTLYVSAIDSGAWRSVDGWGTSKSRPQSTRSVMQYTYTGSNPYSGAWFYGLQAAQLTGRTITAVRFHIPARLSVGSYNSTLSAHLYLHTAAGKPSGDVTRTLGPSDQSLTAGYTGLDAGGSPIFVTLPLAWAPTLIAGGGIGITGTPYLGLDGTDVDPTSGQLSIDWTR